MEQTTDSLLSYDQDAGWTLTVRHVTPYRAVFAIGIPKAQTENIRFWNNQKLSRTKKGLH